MLRDNLLGDRDMIKFNLGLFLFLFFLNDLVRLKRLVAANGTDLGVRERILENILVNDRDRLSDLLFRKSLRLEINDIVKKLLITAGSLAHTLKGKLTRRSGDRR